MASYIPTQPSTRPSAPSVPEPTDKSDRIFIEVLRKNIHYILDVKLNSTAAIIKRMINGISQIPPENQRIYYEDRIMGPNDTLASLGITKEMASLSKKFVQLGLAIRRYELFEKLEIQPVAEPPELPEVFKEFESELDPREADVPQSAGPSVSSDDGVCPGAATAAAQIAAKRAAARAAASGPSGEGAGSSGVAGPSGEGAGSSGVAGPSGEGAGSSGVAGPSGEGAGSSGVAGPSGEGAGFFGEGAGFFEGAGAAGPSGEGAGSSGESVGPSPAKITKR